MSLRDVCARLSKDGSPKILLIHTPKETVVQELNLVKAEARHRSFIISTWVKSYEAQARKQGIGREYAEAEPAIAESRWEDCIVATDDDGYTVYGWVCGSRNGGMLWHAYVIPELRRLRVATRLIEYACGELNYYARPWPFMSHARVNPYLLCKK